MKLSSINILLQCFFLLNHSSFFNNYEYIRNVNNGKIGRPQRTDIVSAFTSNYQAFSFGRQNKATAAAGTINHDSTNNGVSTIFSSKKISASRNQMESYLPIMKGEGNEEIDDAYQNVAKYDAEWFEKFVISTVGEDTVREIIGAKNQLTTQAQEESIDQSRTEARNNTLGENVPVIRKSNISDDKNKAKQSVSNNNGNITFSTAAASKINPEEVASVHNAVTYSEENESDFSFISAGASTINEISNNKDPGSSKEAILLLQDKGSFSSMKKEKNVSSLLLLPKEKCEEASKSSSAAINIDILKKNDEDDIVVLYKDLYDRNDASRCVAYEDFAELYYCKEEIVTIRADVVSLIIEDRIKKPRAGIPHSWKIPKDERETPTKDVRIMNRSEAEIIIMNNTRSNNKQRKDNLARTKINQKRGGNEIESKITGREGTKTFQQSTIRAEDEWERRLGVLGNNGRITKSRQQPLERRKYPAVVRSKGTNNLIYDDGNKRRISKTQKSLSVNNKSKKRIADPPPPQSPLWVDISTFRDLLRRESEMRVSILGEDWTDEIKDENNWRLDLYKKWLWALNDGFANVDDIEIRRQNQISASKTLREYNQFARQRKKQNEN